MATRTSSMISQEQYLGSVRGRPIDHNIGWEMFPGKTEATETNEINYFDQLNEDRRNTLRDLQPEQTGLFPYEQPRRDTYARGHLNLREGYFGSLTDSWMNSGQNGKDGFDISFHDHDPRGWSTEQPWKEYRKLAETQFKNIDYKDDSDNSVPSQGIHPNSMYKQIRASQNWVKSRMKIYSEEWEGKSNGGVGIYPNTSRIYQSNWEESGVGTDNSGPSKTFDDPENHQHHNVNISNIVNLGSKWLRTNNTTDHLVKVAAYNKLYKSKGLLTHETQLRILEDDTPWSNLEGSKQTPRNLVKLMTSQIYSDNPNISRYTASEIARILRQSDQLEELKPNMGREEMENYNRNLILTRDIVGLLGFSESDIKYLESKKNKNHKSAGKLLAKIQELITTVHKASPNEKLQMRNELILRSCGMGLSPATGSELRKIQDSVIVNPKIVQFMSLNTKKRKELPESGRDGLMDPENKLDHILSKTPLFVYKTPNKKTDDLIRFGNPDGKLRDQTKTIGDYKHLEKYSKHLEKNLRMGIGAQLPGESNPTPEYTSMFISQDNHQENLRKTALDNEFGDNRYLTRLGGIIGTKQMRRYITGDYIGNDGMVEKVSIST